MMALGNAAPDEHYDLISQTCSHLP